jgi:hypothetical protein
VRFFKIGRAWALAKFVLHAVAAARGVFHRQIAGRAGFEILRTGCAGAVLASFVVLSRVAVSRWEKNAAAICGRCLFSWLRWR